MISIVEAHHGPENQRYAIMLDDQARVEVVVYRGDSLCISCQVGCAVSCPFCASGAHGLARNLTFEELVAQVDLIREKHPDVARVTLSGVGEPLHNIDTVARFINWGRDQMLPVSLTTSGGPVRHLRLALSLPHRGLTVSVHAGSEATRKRLVPRGPSLKSLFTVLQEELKKLSSSRRRKLALAYLMLDGINDSDNEIDRFLALVQPLGVKIHLYAHNAINGDDIHHTSEIRYQKIFERMLKAGLNVRRSSQSRIQENGGCGTLLAFRPVQIRSVRPDPKDPIPAS